MNRTIVAAALLALSWGTAAQDAPPVAQRLAAPCAICHGTGGRPVTQEVTQLAGMPRDQIAAQMRAFRDGQRPATVMHQIAKGYSDAQIDAIAGWFSSQKR
jgi:cytochrome c553